MMVLHGDYSELEREVARLDKMPDARMAGLLGVVLNFGLAEVKGAVHIDTGSLKASGKSEDETSGKQWEGSFTFGGVSPGVNNPVDYAIYELARGDSHYFMSPVKDLDPLWVTAILTGLGK
jgi:hypothetical protein